jgi:hypothetical protein
MVQAALPQVDPFLLRMIIVLAIVPTVVAALTVVVLSFMLKKKMHDNSNKLDALSLSVDGRLSQLLEVTKESSFGAGRAQGTREERETKR